MRTYYIYLLKNEIVSEYKGNEQKLFNLFSEYFYATGEQRDILEKQVTYITNLLSIKGINDYLVSSLQPNDKYLFADGKHYVDGKIKLSVHEQYIKMDSKENSEVEALFFEVLRKNIQNLLAIDYDNKLFGWLTPIKLKNFQ